MALSESVILTSFFIDINSSNVLHELKEESLFERFTQAEMQNPSRRKIVNDMPVYASRHFDRQMLHGHAVLGDVDSAVSGEKTWNHDVQPNVYRSPEVMLGTGWSYPIDIWNVGVMVYSAYLLSISCTDHLGIIGMGSV